jgi:hypothetical protein
MITVQKQSVANWLLADFMSTSYTIDEKIRLLERKYGQTWAEFSRQIESAKDEDFERWDDYIEWKAYIKMAEDLAFKIGEVKHGNFEVA